jgi:hypothetical protein
MILLSLGLNPPPPLETLRQMRRDKESLVQIAGIALMTAKPETEIHDKSTSRRTRWSALVDSVDTSNALGSARARRAVEDQSEADELGGDGVAEVGVESALAST